MYTKHNYTVTPEEAAIWLGTKNSRNRPVSENAVSKYAQEMKDGRWVDNGQPIIFGTDSQLLNGQHRLFACVRSGKQFSTTITYGVDPKSFGTIDDANSRSLADVLHIEGESNSTLLSAGVRFIWMYATGQVEYQDLRRGKIATKPLLWATLDKNRKITSSTKFISMLKARTGGLLITAGMAVGLHYLFSLVDEKKADEFFNRFQSGLELTEDNPIHLLRARLIAGQKEASTKITRLAMYYYTVTAWNAYVSGTYMKRMVFNVDTPQPEIDNLPKKLMKDLL